MPEPADGAVIRAGGAILWRPQEDGSEVALVHRPGYDDWTFPKGKLKDGEHLLRAAVREVAEEAGVRPQLGRRLPPRWYRKGQRMKRVDYWAATAAEEVDRVPTDEVDQVRWLPLPAAERQLTYDRDVDLLRQFAAGPALTTPYLLLRHASAGDKRSWRDDDSLRPLDARGRREAADLATLLTSFGAARVLSSATARCLETVLPYAAATAAEIRTDPALTFATATAEGARDLLRRLLDEDKPTLLCTHGEVVPEILGQACAQLGADPPEDTGLRKASFWVLHVAGGELTSLEQHGCQP